jgi:serine protease Do
MGTRVNRLRAGALALLITAGVPLLGAPPASAQQQPPTEDLYALVEPSVVQLGVGWGGFVNYPTVDGTTVWSEQITGVSRCSGFFVTTTGHIVTAGHCVEPTTGREVLIKTMLQQQVDQGLLTQAEAQALVPEALAGWLVEGATPASAITRAIHAIQPKETPGAVLTDSRSAQLLDLRAFEEGDLALLKVETTGAVPIPLAETDPRIGTQVTSIGFPSSVSQAVDASLVRASFKSGTVSSTQVSEGGVARIEVNADLGSGMSGGPTVDALGNAVGVNSFLVRGDEQAFNFITDTSDLRDWVGAKNLQLAALRSPPADTGAAPANSSSGIPVWALAVMGAALLLLVGLGAILLVRGRRAAPAQHPAPASPPVGAFTDEHGRAGAPTGSSVPTYSPAPRPSWSPHPTGQTPAEPPPPGRCPRCAQGNATAARYCSNCGASLT